MSVNDANLIIVYRERKKVQQRENYDKECKAYVVAIKKYEAGKVLMDKINDAEEHDRMFVLTNSALETLIVWKWSAKPKHEWEKVKSIERKE